VGSMGIVGRCCVTARLNHIIRPAASPEYDKQIHPRDALQVQRFKFDLASVRVPIGDEAREAGAELGGHVAT
jgi:hypothetical protein